MIIHHLLGSLLWEGHSASQWHYDLDLSAHHEDSLAAYIRITLPALWNIGHPPFHSLTWVLVLHLHILNIGLCSKPVEICSSSTTKAARVIICCIRLFTYMMEVIDWRWLWLPWPSSHFPQPDLSYVACTLWVFGCAARQLRCCSSTTKQVRVIICCVNLLTYMLDGIGY
jgi:hypothetical protein